jgi:UDP-glucose 4-epimerase
VSRRKPRKQRIVLTGIGGRLGRAVARRLHRQHEIVGVDRRSVKTMPKDILLEKVDIRRRKFEDIFRREQIDAVIHLNIMHDPRTSSQEHHDFNLVGTKRIFELCAEHRVGKIIVLSSANVYGPDPKNTQFLTEDAPLMGGQHFGAIRDLIALDMCCSTFFWRHPVIETVILRPVHIVGNVSNAPSRFLRLKRPMTLLGFDPMLQLIHVDDVVTAIERALTPGIRGIYNIAGPSPVPLSFVLSRLNTQARPLPEPVLKTILKLGWATRLSDWPWPELDHIKYICTVDDTRAREELGFSPRHDIDAILRAVSDPVETWRHRSK